MSENLTNFWSPCWACRVMSGECFGGGVVKENDNTIVVINPFSIFDGHSLVMPRRHIENIYTLPDDIAGEILSTAASVARAVKKAFAADGITLRQNNEPASDQHLFHFHLHVIPRFEGDSEKFETPPKFSDEEKQKSAASKLRAVL